MESLPFAIFSLLYPLFGLTRALALFDQYLKFGKGKDEIGMAIAQGAVMVAVRSEDWEPSTQEQRVFVGLPPECFADTKRLEPLRIIVIFALTQYLQRCRLSKSQV